MSLNTCLLLLFSLYNFLKQIKPMNMCLQKFIGIVMCINEHIPIFPVNCYKSVDYFQVMVFAWTI